MFRLFTNFIPLFSSASSYVVVGQVLGVCRWFLVFLVGSWWLSLWWLSVVLGVSVWFWVVLGGYRRILVVLGGSGWVA